MPQNSKSNTLLASFAISVFLLGAATALPVRADSPEVILHPFTNSTTDGAFPEGAPALGPDGAFYGTTYTGGLTGDGIVYKIGLLGLFTVLHNFGDGTVPGDGELPGKTLTLGPDGMLYGTTQVGGANGNGIIFKISSLGIETVLCPFPAGDDGVNPESVVTFGKDGRLYGTTHGPDLIGSTDFGTIYSVKPDGTDYVVQYRFDTSKGKSVGGGPNSLTPGIGSDPALYGTCYGGGGGKVGMIFSFVPGQTDGSGAVTDLHNFHDNTAAQDGAYPIGNVVFDSDGNLYGTTSDGGLENDGTVFKLSADLKESILHRFSINVDGSMPESGPIIGSDGNLYGTAAYGGKNDDTGTVYSVSTSGSNFRLVYTFGKDGSGDGLYAYGGVIEDGAGDLIGTTYQGGVGGYGTVYKLNSVVNKPFGLASLTVTPSVLTGNSERVTGYVTLTGPAPAGGIRVGLSSSYPYAASVGTGLHIPAGVTVAPFDIQTGQVAQSIQAIIAATYNGQTVFAPLTVTPMPTSPTLAGVVLSPATRTGGSDSGDLDFVYLTGDATADTSVTVTSSDTDAARVEGAPLTIHQGYTRYFFHIKTLKVTTAKTVTITAKLNGATQSAILTVNP